MIDFSNLPLAPNESRAARNFFGLSQAQAAEQSGLPVHKLKRFESGNYVPDTEFLQDLRAFFEGQGFNFHDADAPGARAKANGDVVPAGVVDPSGSTLETDSSTQGQLLTKQLQFIRISPALKGDQVDRVFDRIEANEAAVEAAMQAPVTSGFLVLGPSQATQAAAVAALRRLAENGVLFARMLGRDPVPSFQPGEAPSADAAKTIGDLLRLALNDVQADAVDDDKGAQARRKAGAAPTEVLQALVG